MWLLEANGAFTHEPPFDPGLELGAEAAAEVAAPLVARTVTIRFSGTADGRGFSAARRLRTRGFTGRLVAAGPLIPDQAREAFQCGFDAILVSDEAAARHGVASWREAIRHAVPELYLADDVSRGPERGIWARRHLH